MLKRIVITSSRSTNQKNSRKKLEKESNNKSKSSRNKQRVLKVSI